jgi:hypothetical protein
MLDLVKELLREYPELQALGVIGEGAVRHEETG